MGAGYNETLPSRKPFMFMERYDTRGSIGVIAFGAFNAMGLIGSEKGGVAIVMEPPMAAVIATKDIPWKPDKRRALANRLLKAETAADVIRAAVSEGGFEWCADAESVIAALERDEKKACGA